MMFRRFMIVIWTLAGIGWVFIMALAALAVALIWVNR